MRIFIPLIIFSALAAGCVHVSTDAQIRASNNGKVTVPNSNMKTPNRRKDPIDLRKIDFKNFTFPDFSGLESKTFTLKNGISQGSQTQPNYKLRKTYFFDLTDDDEDEAVSHIIADGCQMGCESSNLFYVYTADDRQSKLLWKIAIGGNVLGGLKAANFKVNEIVMEVFGDCNIENGIIKPKIDMKNNSRMRTSNYTRFVFSGGEAGFSQTGKEVIPLTTNIDFTEYRAQIRFGD